MGIIGRVLKTTVEKIITVTAEIYFSNNREVDFFTASGDESPPLPEDRILLVKVNGSGEFAGIGVLTDSQGAKPGEKIIFGRDKDGKTVSILKMLNDGSVSLSSDKNTLIDAQKIILNGEGKGAARKTDEVKSTMLDDQIFWTWITAAGTALSSIGVVAPVPTSLTAKITGASATVEIGD